MGSWIAVGVGGAIGSMARHGVNIFVSRRVAQSIPLATGVVNIAGCVVIGLLAGALVSARLRMDVSTRAFVFVGILGGFTTFSTFGLDTFTLMHEGRMLAATLNVLVQVVGGLAGIYAGYWLAS